MASLRGATKVWDSEAVEANDVSAPAYVLSTNVALFVSNEGINSHVFKVQTAESGDDRGGLNEFDSTSLPDGGLVWYDFLVPDASATMTFTVGNGAAVCVDLSPFASQLVRLVCTSGTSNDITAIIASYGPN